MMNNIDIAMMPSTLPGGVPSACRLVPHRSKIEGRREPTSRKFISIMPAWAQQSGTSESQAGAHAQLRFRTFGRPHSRRAPRTPGPRSAQLIFRPRLYRYRMGPGEPKPAGIHQNPDANASPSRAAVYGSITKRDLLQLAYCVALED